MTLKHFPILRLNFFFTSLVDTKVSIFEGKTNTDFGIYVVIIIKNNVKVT